MARQRLRSAAEIEVRDVESAPDGPRAFEVVARNVGAGHALPTSLTEIREMWVELLVTSPDGSAVLHRGALDTQGEVPADSIRFGAVMEDAAGEVTVKPRGACASGASGSSRRRARTSPAWRGLAPRVDRET